MAGISPLAFEVTGQVEARREADQQRELLHTLFMKAPVPIVILDGSELVYQLVNPAYQQIFPGRELLGKPLLKALPELAGTDIPAILSRVYQTGETFVARELPLMLARYQGGPLEKIYWTFTYQARHNDRGRVDGVLVFAHEVTDQVQSRQVVEVSEQQAQALAQELAASNEELQAANEQVRASNENLGQVNTQLQRTNVDLDTFIYTASHDLKAPIANIEGLMKILLRQLPAESLQAEPVQETISFIQDSVSRFKRTIANLTEVVKLQKEADQPTVDVDLASITRAVLLDLALQIGESGAQVIVEVSHCTKVSFTEKNLRSVLYNLLSNAIKYRSPDRSLVVQIYCQPSGGYKLLTVADNGMGMDLERRHKLFSMFQRFHDHVEGSGIGLYMVKRMIENAGGKIEVESQVGVGSSFRVYFTRYD
jgi:signal transduction histidine kinase